MVIEINGIYDKTGMKFGALTVLRKIEPRISLKGEKITRYECKCDCGNFIVCDTAELRKNGKRKSCGCRRREPKTHGESRTRLYRCWCTMRRRCYDKNFKDYPLYHGYGINVCDQWSEFAVFRDWAISNGYNDTLTLDRIDNYLGYCPQNCRWVDQKTQCNNKRNNHIIEYNGESHNLTEWAKILGMSSQILTARLKCRDWDIGRVLLGKMKPGPKKRESKGEN